MKCPVCKTDGILETKKTCPHCHSDLEAFHLTGSLKKSFRQRLYFSILSSILFIAVLLVWVVSTGAVKNEDSADLQTTSAIAQEGIEKQQVVEKENSRLETENAQLKKQLSELQKKQEKRQKNYVVSDGESLFSIARKVYGNGYRYEDLANDNNIVQPNQITVGQELIIYY